MNIRLLSDLHMEFWKYGYPEWMYTKNDVLILAGDITVGPTRLKLALEHFAEHSHHVIYVPGNHEYYGHSINSLDNISLPANVHFLNPGCIKINEVTFIGATLWTDFRNNKKHEKVASKYITDFKRIKNFSTLDCKSLYNYHHDYILKAVRDIPGQKIIVTHFLPGSHCVSPKYLDKGYPTDELNAYFAPNPNINTHEVSHWFFGHTHESVDTMVNQTRYVANPFGYEGYETNENFKSQIL